VVAPVSIRRDGDIAVITIDNPPVNAISRAVRQGLLDAARELATDTGVRAVVLLCAGRTFMAGADISEFGGSLLPNLNQVIDELESLPQPVVAGLQGTALGGGVEVALGCHYRVADRAALLGFPEITLGIVPGAGGTQRLPRLIGAEAALTLILDGKPVGADAARALGLVDAVVEGDLRAATVAYARTLLAERRGPRRLRDAIVTPLSDTQFAKIRAQAGRLHRGVATAELDLLAVRAAWELPFEQGRAVEYAISAGSLQTPESRAMRQLFFAERAVAQVPGIGTADLPREVKRVGIIGSGTMGGGIAMAFANAGLSVLLIDVDQAALDRGLATVRRNYDTSVQRGRMTPDEVAQRMGLLQSATDYAALRDVDLVIEAVFEDMALKKQIFVQLDRVCRPGAILATNTSTLDVDQIGAVTSRPQDVIGLHFFSPANVMRLLEIVRTDATANDVVATAFALAKKIRKIGVLSKVCFGFIGNRMMDPYAREAERLVLEGATPAQVDGALEDFGMAMGILAVFDMAGIDVGVKVRQANPDQGSTDPSFYRADQVLYAQGWIGQKAGRGYYRYEAGSRERLAHPQAQALLAEESLRLGLPRRTDIGAREIVERCLFPMINEGARILEEGVALRPGDIDVVYTSGYGFPRFRGGPMSYADEVGLDAVLAGIEKYGRLGHAPDWSPAPLLVQLAREGSTFAAWQAARYAGA
jgi:3-hydroxyacyl-CoA dehydrogenase